MDLSKQLEFFDPAALRNEEVHIIGLGAIGSAIADLLAHMGVNNIHLYDFDTIEEHNLANQNYTLNDIGNTKVLATATKINEINTEATITLHEKGWRPNSQLSGYIFLCVDNIDIRRAIVEENEYNTQIKAMFDFRLGLQDAQHYACSWEEHDNIKKFLSTMNFTHAEAKEAMPVSACGTTLSVIPTVRAIVAFGMSNWINFVKTSKLKTIILMNAFTYQITAF